MHANYTEQERISRVKKVYSTLANAMTRVKADGGNMIFDVQNDNISQLNEWYDTFLKPHLIIDKTCYNYAKGCWNETGTKMLNGSTSTPTTNRTGVGLGTVIITAVLNDGTFIDIDPLDIRQVRNSFKVNADPTATAAYVFYFDINGFKKPNTIGKDIFAMVFTEDGLVPAYKDATHEQIDADCSSTGTGHSCLIKYLGK